MNNEIKIIFFETFSCFFIVSNIEFIERNFLSSNFFNSFQYKFFRINKTINYCYIVTNTETFLVPHTLKYISEQIESDNFVKSHRSYVVNLKHVQSVNKNSLSFENENIPISASQKSLVITKLKSM